MKATFLVQSALKCSFFFCTITNRRLKGTCGFLWEVHNERNKGYGILSGQHESRKSGIKSGSADMFSTERYYTEVQTIIKETGRVFSDKFSHFFELKKAGKAVPNTNNRKALRLQFLSAESEAQLK